MFRRSARIAAKNYIPPTLLNLPPEIRPLIYEALLEDMICDYEGPIWVSRNSAGSLGSFDWDSRCQRIRDEKTGLRILWVCKQIRKEVRYFLLRCSTTVARRSVPVESYSGELELVC